MAIHYNSETKEPYLMLPEPHANIILTPHRPNSLDETASALFAILNDPRVAVRLQRTPYPYSLSDGEEWVKANCKDQEGILFALREELEESGHSVSQKDPSNFLHHGRRVFDTCPFTCIREVLRTDHGTGAPVEDILIGDIRLARSGFDEYPEGSEERSLAQQQNDELPVGDKSIVWSLADFLVPSHHGRGIMTLAVRTIIHDWAVPRMNVQRLKSSAFEDNEGSLRVFEKNNFIRGHTLKDWATVSESRGGGKRSIVLMEWTGEDGK